MKKEYIDYIVNLGNLTSLQYRTLLLLNTKEYTQKELSEILKTHKANVNKAVATLQEMKLIEIVRKEGMNMFFKAVNQEKVIERSKMSNKDLLIEEINKFNTKYNSNFHLGCYDDDIEKLSKVQLNKVIEEMTGDYTDVKVYIGKQAFIVELSWITGTAEGDEVDFIMKSLKQYESQYGRKFE